MDKKSFFPTVIESLFSLGRNSLFGPIIESNVAQIKKQTNKRLSLITRLDIIFSSCRYANTDISEIVRLGRVSLDFIAATYNELSDFLQAETYNKRLLLYLPFALIPARSLRSKNKNLNHAFDRFIDAYLNKWKELLSEEDYRTNFVDGDIDERLLNTEPLEKVIKAAHLAPFLVKKEIISNLEIVYMWKTSRNKILKASLREAILVISDMGLLSGDICKIMSKSSDPFLNSLVQEENSCQPLNVDIQKNNKPTKKVSKSWFMDLPRRVEEDFEKFEKLFQQNKNNVALGRMIWCKKRDEDDLIKRYATQVAKAFEQSLLVNEDMNDFVASCNAPASIRLSVACIMRTAEKLFFKNQTQARLLIIGLEKYLKSLSDSKDQAIINDLAILESRLTFLGVINDERKNPKKFSFDFTDIINRCVSGTEKEKVSLILQTIEADKTLSKVVYPAINLYGSKAKGYAAEDTDLDMALFFKPGADFASRNDVRKRLQVILEEIEVRGSFIEFWLTKAEDGLEIIDFDISENYLVDGSCAHVLFEGIWYGTNYAVREIFKKLITDYLLTEESGGKHRSLRNFLLGEMERNTLQYRLIHKGYHSLFPEIGGVSTPNSASIDSDSAFWDSGYRQLATKLFIQKIYLPQI